MAYGLKYYSEFRDHFDRLCQLNIELLNYTGEASELELASDPVVIERSVDSVLSPLLTMSCKVNVWSSFNYQFEDLFLAAPRDYKVTFIRSNKQCNNKKVWISIQRRNRGHCPHRCQRH